MKELHELNLPEDIFYTKEHEWAKIDGDVIVVGISDYAQDQLGDIVFVELPEIGDSFAEGNECCTLESVKAVSELYIPVSGEIVDINEELNDTPELLNHDPYGGWIIKIKAANVEDLKKLLDQKNYLRMLEGDRK